MHLDIHHAQRILRQRYPHIDTPIWSQRSTYSVILCTQNGDGPTVIKMPVPWRLRDLDGNQRVQLAQWLNETTSTFLERLSARGVLLPRSYETELVDGYSVHLISYEGEDNATIVQRHPRELPALLREMLKSIRPVLLSGEQAVGLDARLGNFSGGIYIDVFPPLVQYQDSHLVHFPNPSDPEIVAQEVDRKFSPFGILRRLRFDLIALDPDLECIFFSALDYFEEPFRSAMRDAFASLPDAKIPSLTRFERAQLTEGIPANEVDTLREVAAKLIPLRGRERSAVLDEVFYTTSRSITTSFSEHDERISRFREILKPFL